MARRTHPAWTNQPVAIRLLSLHIFGVPFSALRAPSFFLVSPACSLAGYLRIPAVRTKYLLTLPAFASTHQHWRLVRSNRATWRSNLTVTLTF